MSPAVLFWLTSNRKLIFNYKKEDITRDLKHVFSFLVSQDNIVCRIITHLSLSLLTFNCCDFIHFISFLSVWKLNYCKGNNHQLHNLKTATVILCLTLGRNLDILTDSFTTFILKNNWNEGNAAYNLLMKQKLERSNVTVLYLTTTLAQTEISLIKRDWHNILTLIFSDDFGDPDWT